MSPAVLVIVLLDLALIGALPRLFFRRGSLNARWWLTATPFITAGVLVVACALGWLHPLRPAGAPARAVLDAGATLLAAASIALIAFACGVHRRPPSLWHQPDDTPAEIVTAGPYARMRHPFYTAFLIGLGAVALAAPHAATLADLVLAAILLNRTAAREERRLCASIHGELYRAYLARTHRFHPRVGRSVR